MRRHDRSRQGWDTPAWFRWQSADLASTSPSLPSEERPPSSRIGLAWRVERDRELAFHSLHPAGTMRPGDPWTPVEHEPPLRTPTSRECIGPRDLYDLVAAVLIWTFPPLLRYRRYALLEEERSLRVEE